jgi:hypothetical protein
LSFGAGIEHHVVSGDVVSHEAQNGGFVTGGDKGFVEQIIRYSIY